MLCKSLRPILFQNYDIIRIIEAMREKTNPEMRFDIIIPPTIKTRYNYMILGMSFSSILVFLYLTRNKK